MHHKDVVLRFKMQITSPEANTGFVLESEQKLRH